jgi:AraC family transcriptional regulator
MEDRNGYKERILRVLTHIEQRLDEDISLDDLAEVACFSPYHFHRIFRGMVGESVMSYIRRLKLERAAQRLTYSDTPITNVAFDAGYEAHESFIRAFQARFSSTPSGYRTDTRRRIHEELLKKESKGVTPMDVSIVKMPAKTVAFVRHVGPYKDCGPAWEKLMRWAGQKGLFGPDTELLGICYDDPDVTPPEKIRFDACFTVEPGTVGDGDIGIQETGGRDHAMVVHKGSYNNLIHTYAYVCGQWLPKSGREIYSGPTIEIYRNHPDDTPEDKLITDVYIPLEDR